MKSLAVTVLLFILNFSAFSQGTLRGKISDESGETLIGVTVVFKENRSSGVVTDFDGNFSLKFTDSQPHTIVISYISYAEIEETFTLKNNETVIQNFIMKSSSKAIGEVQITAKAVKAKDYYIESIKRNSAITLDYISSETMKKTGDANVTSAIARVAGVSTNAGFITVRGVGDRYIKTSLNGAVIPTLDPFTNNIKLDIFPATLIDNILITKTASADLPGDWSGAYISVETKDYPDQLALNIETSFGYNNQSVFKNVLTSERSKTDWLGYDSDLREFDHSMYVRPNTSPTIYQEMAALGLSGYFNSLGINGDNWGEGTERGETYFKLGLIQLGLLAPALIDDHDAFIAAKNLYESGSYRSDAFKVLNANIPKNGKSFSNSWNTFKREGPINFSQSFSIGNQIKLFGRDLGFIAGYRYGTAVQYDPSSTALRLRPDEVYGGYATASSLTQETSRETNGWSALFNLSYKLSPNHSVGLLFMPNMNGVNNVRSSVDENDPGNFVWTKSQFYEQRKQLVYQFKSEHYFPKLKIKLEPQASYTRGKSIAPDFRNLQYFEDPLNNSYQVGGAIGDGVHRYYRYLTDNVLDARISGEVPISKMPGFTRKIKIGASYLLNDKRFDQYDYSLNFGRFSPTLQNDDLDSFFGPDNYDITTLISNGIETSTIFQYYSESESKANHTLGNSEVKAAFALADYVISSRLRIAGGVRVEDAHIFTDVVEFDSLGYAKNDPRRAYSTAYPIANPGELNELSILPSVNLVFKVKESEATPMNLRLNFSQTVARPSIRELSDVALFDYEFRTFVFGNSDLKVVNINNYDLRLENYFKNGDDISFSAFRKDFKNHIELINGGGISWQNVDNSYLYGIELEGKKKITTKLDFRANITLVKSQTKYVRTRLEIDGGVKNYIPLDEVTRTMYGQSPYVINAILNFTADSIGFNATVSYNVQGARLVIVSEIPQLPDIYELPRNTIDVKVSKKLGKHFIVAFTIKDLLNTPVRRSFKTEEDEFSKDYDKFRYGSSYGLSLSYRL